MIGATIILYKPDMEVTARLIEITAQQVDVISIVDNSPDPTDITISNENFHYHHFPNNIGIAAAHNIGLSDLRAAGCHYGMLLDQDSAIDENLAFRLSSLLVAARVEEQPLVAIGPRIICSFSEKTVKPRMQKEISIYDNLVCVTQIISSGMMIDLSKLDLIGLKDEALFIDGVDHEWCWRAKTQDFSVAIAKNIEMVHKLGDARSQFAGFTYKVGAPIRLYYQFRNILLLTRREYVPNYWKCRNLFVLPIRFFANSLLQNNKRLRLKYMVLGLWDGFLGKSGPYHSHH